MTTIRIALVVGGHGEVDAGPVLVRRLVQHLDPSVHVDLPRPLRVSESKLVKPGELERTIDVAARLAHGGGVLVLLDCDDGCPAAEGPRLLARAEAARPGVVVEVALARREFETWFLAAAESL